MVTPSPDLFSHNLSEGEVVVLQSAKYEKEKQIDYFKSPDFARDIVKGIYATSKPLKIETNEPTDIKKIPKNDMEQFIELRKKGYNITYENETYLIMEKD